MKKTLLVIGIFISVQTVFGQAGYVPLAQNDTVDIKSHSLNFDNNHSLLLSILTDRIKNLVPVVLPSYATGSMPSIPNSLVFNSDSLTGTGHAALWYINGSGTAGPVSVGGSGGGGGVTLPLLDNQDLFANSSDATKKIRFALSPITTATTRTWTFPDVSGTFARIDAGQTFTGANTFGTGQIFGNNVTFGASTTTLPHFTLTPGSAVTSPSDGMGYYDGTHLYFRHGSITTDLLSPSCATCIVDGLNTPSADINIGTSNSHNIVFKANNAIVATFYASDGHVFFGNGSGGDPTQFFYFQGTSRFDGAMTIGANSGFSVINSANFSSSASNSSPSGYGWYWGMNAPFGSGTKSFMRLQPDATLTSGTSSVKGIDMSGTINNSGAGTYTIWGIYYNPTLTSLTNTTHIFMENTTGDVKFNTTSGKVSFFGAHILASPTTTLASINFPAGTAVTSPGQGDMYATLGHFFYHDQSTTYDFLAFAPLASPTFTGTPSLPTGTTGVTQSPGDNSTKLSTTAYADAIAALKANIASPTFTGSPVLPTGTTGVTQTQGDNSTKLATTAYADAHLPALKASGNSLANTSNTTIATFTPAANGNFQIGAYVTVTAITSANTQVQITWTDQNNNSQAYDIPILGTASPFFTTTGTYPLPTVNIRAKSGSAITVSVVIGTGTITFDAGGTITETL